MGFFRNPQPVRHVNVREAVEGLIGELLAQEVAAMVCVAVVEAPDPFNIENDCLNPAGHYQIRDGRQIVCAHCSKVFWP